MRHSVVRETPYTSSMSLGEYHSRLFEIMSRRAILLSVNGYCLHKRSRKNLFIRSFYEHPSLGRCILLRSVLCRVQDETDFIYSSFTLKEEVLQTG